MFSGDTNFRWYEYSWRPREIRITEVLLYMVVTSIESSRGIFMYDAAIAYVVRLYKFRRIWNCKAMFHLLCSFISTCLRCWTRQCRVVMVPMHTVTYVLDALQMHDRRAVCLDAVMTKPCECTVMLHSVALLTKSRQCSTLHCCC